MRCGSAEPPWSQGRLDRPCRWHSETAGRPSSRLFSISELACASSSGIELISIAWFGMRFPETRSSANAARAAMQLRRMALVSVSEAGGRFGRSLKGRLGSNAMSMYPAAVDTCFRTCRSHRHVTPTCRCMENISTRWAVARRSSPSPFAFNPALVVSDRRDPASRPFRPVSSGCPSRNLAASRAINFHSAEHKPYNQPMPKPAFYPRHVEQRLIEALDDSPVVLIHGPRQCGKTTLAQYTCAESYLTLDDGSELLLDDGGPLSLGTASESRDYTYISLDDAVARDGARAESRGFRRRPARARHPGRDPARAGAVRGHQGGGGPPAGGRGASCSPGPRTSCCFPACPNRWPDACRSCGSIRWRSGSLRQTRLRPMRTGPRSSLTACSMPVSTCKPAGSARRGSRPARDRGVDSRRRWRVPRPGGGPTGSATTWKRWCSATCAT